MYGKWMCFVVLDLIILTHSTPGRFFHSQDKPAWGQDWSHGWEHDWYGHTTQRAWTKGTTTTEAPVEPRSSTTPSQPAISDVEIRLGEVTTTNVLAEVLTDRQTLQAFAPGPEDDLENAEKPATTTTVRTEYIDLDSGTPAATTTVRTEYIDLDSGRPATTPTVNTEAAPNGLEAKPDDNTSLWHVAIYLRMGGSYEHICGGSLIKKDTVVSAGHCFTPVSQQLPLTLFRVAAGKIYSRYDDPRDTNAQYSDIKNISSTSEIEMIVPPCRQPDLAILDLATPFKYTSVVKPLCINFYVRLEEEQLKEGTFGTVPSWSVQENGECKPSQSLTWLSLPFVKEEVCQYKSNSKTDGRDRICAGNINNATQCETDSGNALVFYQGVTPYLRGVTTNIIENRRRCTKFYTRSFTNIIGATKHLKRYFKETFDNFNFEECVNFYNNPTMQTEAPQNETVTESNFGDGFIGTDPSEEDQIFITQAIGSMPVPTLPQSNAPAFQWHVGIYSKAWAPFMQICGGSLVKRDFVISAAHCFWDDAAGRQPASQFAVAGGKLFRPWNNTQDTYAQHSDVSEIMLPVRFRGSATSFQDDIAILHLSNPFTYAPGVQSVCVDFDSKFEKQQLQPDKMGTVLGYGLTEQNGVPSQRLNYLKLPYVDVDQCYTDSDPAFTKFITSDKICAGNTITGKALCRGDSGGGFVVYSDTIPYLHGVASTAAGNQNLCNAFALAAITSLYSHRSFVRDNIPDIDKECAYNNAEMATYRNCVRWECVLEKGPTRNVARTGSVAPAGNVALTGNVGPTGNQGLKVFVAIADVKAGTATDWACVRWKCVNEGPTENVTPAVSEAPAGNMAPTENLGPAGNVGSAGNLGPEGNVGQTGNQGLNVGGTMGNTVALPVISNVPYYPNHFVCNCNCKP